ncbi:MAG TPA: TonB family protein [Desulfomonilaceae bacterium]|nr:TonB family protein [Desulfomonilaceae bacterium]
MKNTTKHLKALIVVAGLVTSLSALAADVKIIANPSVRTDAISAEELKSVFLEERSSLSDGSRVEPVLSRSGSAHDAFVKEYLGKTDASLQTYYRILVFTGKGSMPKAEASDGDVVAYVARTRGAIGYVGVGTSTEGVKTLSVISADNLGSRRLITRVEPVYPPELYKNHIGGVVRLKVTIASNGSIESAELLGGNPVLGESAMAAVKTWVYSAGSSKTKAEITIPFDPNR